MAERSECPDVKNYKRRLNPVRLRMLYSCTHMAAVGVEGLNCCHVDGVGWFSDHALQLGHVAWQ